MSRFYEKYSNLELADLIASKNILDDGMPDHFREAILRMLWYYQAQKPVERLDWDGSGDQQIRGPS